MSKCTLVRLKQLSSARPWSRLRKFHGLVGIRVSNKGTQCEVDGGLFNVEKIVFSSGGLRKELSTLEINRFETGVKLTATENILCSYNF